MHGVEAAMTAAPSISDGRQSGHGALFEKSQMSANV